MTGYYIGSGALCKTAANRKQQIDALHREYMAQGMSSKEAFKLAKQNAGYSNVHNRMVENQTKQNVRNEVPSSGGTKPAGPAAPSSKPQQSASQQQPRGGSQKPAGQSVKKKPRASQAAAKTENGALKALRNLSKAQKIGLGIGAAGLIGGGAATARYLSSRGED